MTKHPRSTAHFELGPCTLARAGSGKLVDSKS